MDGHGPTPTRELPPTRHPMTQPALAPRLGTAPAVPAPRYPALDHVAGGHPAPGPHRPGFPVGEPPAGLSSYPAGLSAHLAGAYPGPAEPKKQGSRLFVVAVVVAIGMLMASGVVAVGYTLMNAGIFSGASLPTIGAPVPAAQSSPTGDAGTIESAGTTPRQPGVSPRVDQVYLTTMRQRPAFKGSTDTDLFGLGQTTCGELDGGQSFMSIVSAGGGRSLRAEDMGYLTAVSVMAYCPQHKPMLEKLIGQSLPSI